MRVILNATALAQPLSGIGRYVAELMAAMPQEIEVIPFGGGAGDKPGQDESRKGGLTKVLSLLGRHLPGARMMARRIGSRAFSAEARRCRPALYHEPGFIAHPFDGPLVVTAHDASWVRHPETHPPERTRFMNAVFPGVLERANRIIVDSGFVGAEMREIFGVPPEKLRIVPLGVAPRFRPMGEDETASVRARLDIAHGGYLLAVGALEPRKNLRTLLSAYCLLPEPLRRRHPLVVAGMRGWRHAAENAMLDRLARSGQLRLAGHVPDSDLPALYAGAALFVYPSIYEGFGLPPLEAMASGVPVVASDRAALPEVVGNAGRLVSALDADALAAVLLALIEDPAVRDAMSATGQARAASFTWQACASRTAEVYAELA